MTKQLADGLICIHLDKNDWTVDKHLGRETDATSAFIYLSHLSEVGKTWKFYYLQLLIHTRKIIQLVGSPKG